MIYMKNSKRNLRIVNILFTIKSYHIIIKSNEKLIYNDINIILNLTNKYV